MKKLNTRIKIVNKKYHTFVIEIPKSQFMEKYYYEIVLHIWGDDTITYQPLACLFFLILYARHRPTFYSWTQIFGSAVSVHHYIRFCNLKQNKKTTKK